MADRMKFIRGAVQIAALTVLVSCAGSSSPAPSAGGQASPSAGTTSASGSQDGLTAEEAARNIPPPPQNVRVKTAAAGFVELVWDPPPPVSVPHTYSDRIVAYRVFRRDEGAVEPRPIGTTSSRSYVDRTVRSGTTYEYTVASIREQNVEGGRSDPPAVAAVP